MRPGLEAAVKAPLKGILRIMRVHWVNVVAAYEVFREIHVRRRALRRNLNALGTVAGA